MILCLVNTQEKDIVITKHVLAEFSVCTNSQRKCLMSSAWVTRGDSTTTTQNLWITVEFCT